MYNAAVIGLGLSGYKLDQDKARNINNRILINIIRLACYIVEFGGNY